MRLSVMPAFTSLLSTTVRPESNALVRKGFMAFSTAKQSAWVTVVELLMSSARSSKV